MHRNNARKYITNEQAVYMGQVSQQVQALQRLAMADHDPIPIRSGLQMGFILFDCRTPTFSSHTGLLLDVGKKDRYRWMLDGVKQDGLIGWHDSVRSVASKFRPLITLD